MFDGSFPVAAGLGGVDDTDLVSAVSGWARVSAAAEAQKLAAVAELVRRRCTEEHPDWACDDWDATAAEVAAALTIGHGRASAEMDLALTLRDRLPKVGALFLSGDISGRIASAVANRTQLVQDSDALRELDGMIAQCAHDWGPLSQYKLELAVDIRVAEVDPVAVRRARQTVNGRDFTIGDPNDTTGTTSVWGKLSTPDAALLRRRLDAMIRSVCQDDTRTMAQRRADAVGALAAGSTHLACHCGSPKCPAALDDGRASSVMVHVVADAGAIAASAPKVDDTAAETTPTRGVALIPGIANGIIPPPLLAELIAHGAKVRPVTVPSGDAEPRYRASTALDEFIRMRDLTCSFPGCDQPAAHADIDHTVPWPTGPTAPWNLDCKCRKHHLLKTFWLGWSDHQDPDGTVTWTAPTGHTYVTRPLSGLLFPAWAGLRPAETPVVPIHSSGNGQQHSGRSLMMPTRKRTRDEARQYRIRTERAQNELRLGYRDSPPF